MSNENNENEDYDQKANQIRNLGNMPPDQLATHLSSLHNTLEAGAPNVAPHIYTTAANAIQFLNSKLPSHGNELVQDQAPGPSQAQKRAWLDLHSAVNDPVSILDHVSKGTLTSHHVEALQSVYPDLHQEMVQKAAEQLGQLKNNDGMLPYAKRVSLSKLMGQPLDSTLTPPSYQAILAANGASGQQAAQKQPKAKKASGVELNQIDKTNQLSQTSLQAREARSKT